MRLCVFHTESTGFCRIFANQLKMLLCFLSWLSKGLREIGVSYCVHNVTTAVLPSTSSMETLSSGHFMYTIGHTYIPKSLDNQLKNKPEQ